MGFFHKNKRNADNKIEKLMSDEYTQTYFNECKYIWKNYVPKNGRADCLQGELLREIEKIRCEAQDNGNINWNDDFSDFCNFISCELTKQKIFSDKEKEEIIAIMSYFNACGAYAQKFHNGEIAENDVDVDRLAYTKDNLYDIICDKIGRLQKENPTPLPL